MSERDPVNILGELIEDAVIRYSGQIGTLASAHVAEEVIAHLRAHPEDAAAALGGEVYHEWERRGLIDREPFDDAGRICDVLTVDYPWREVTGG